MTARHHRQAACPVCGRMTVYRLAWTRVVGKPSPPRIFRRHNDVLTQTVCARIAEQEQYL